MGEKATSSSCSALACEPALRASRPTVLRFTLASRAVCLTPHPSARCSSTDTALSAGSRALNSGVPLRSPKRALHERQYNSRNVSRLP